MLTLTEKATIKAETGWSDELIAFISSFCEYHIYKGLKEVEIDGRKCLIRSSVPTDDHLRKMKKTGCAMRDDNDRAVELHHIGGTPDSPLAELSYEQHHLNGNYSNLHDTMKKKSQIDRAIFRKIRRDHWKYRAKMILKKDQLSFS